MKPATILASLPWLASLLIPVVGIPAIAQASTILSTNLGEPLSPDSATLPQIATTSNWLAQSFRTDGFSYRLDSITLKMQRSSPISVAELALFSNDPTFPSSPSPLLSLSTLTSPGNYSDTFNDTTFTANGLYLAPNTTYWEVLSASSGEFEWAFTDSSNGSGIGFQPIWTDSNDGGQTWNPSIADQPFLMQVDATQIPEPSNVLFVVGTGLIMFLVRKREPKRTQI